MDPLGRVEVLDFARKLRFEIRGIEPSDWGSATLALNQIGPKRRDVIAQWGQCAQPGNRNTTEFHDLKR